MLMMAWPRNTKILCLGAHCNHFMCFNNSFHNGEPSYARWLYWSRMKDNSFCFEKKLGIEHKNNLLFIRDQYSHLAVKAPHWGPVFTCIFKGGYIRPQLSWEFSHRLLFKKQPASLTDLCLTFRSGSRPRIERTAAADFNGRLPAQVRRVPEVRGLVRRLPLQDSRQDQVRAARDTWAAGEEQVIKPSVIEIVQFTQFWSYVYALEKMLH